MTANMSNPKSLNWKDSAGSFDVLASEYDSWFDNNLLFDIELAALLAVKEKLAHPFLEIGVGPGRFAEVLKINYGIDPAISPLQLASSRSILGIKAIGEQLPVRSGSMGTVFILFTLCFLADPVLVMRECSRILKSDGCLIIGLIPRLSKWGKLLTRKKKENNPFYRHARLRTIAEAVEMLTMNGFSMIESWTTLFQSPDNSLAAESPRRGLDEHAGFCVLVMNKKEAASEITKPDHPDD
jgi:ubiquinone/menaquinone biosynthesis C-methylase UbiE